MKNPIFFIASVAEEGSRFFRPILKTIISATGIYS